MGRGRIQYDERENRGNVSPFTSLSLSASSFIVFSFLYIYIYIYIRKTKHDKKMDVWLLLPLIK
jgi:hypothetical protein